MTKSNANEYNKIYKEPRRECQFVKERMLTEKCERFEQLEAAHKSYQTHAQIREVTERKQRALRIELAKS